MPYPSKYYFGGVDPGRKTELKSLNHKEERYFYYFSIPDNLVIPNKNCALQRLIDYLAQHPDQNHRYFAFCCAKKGDRGFHQKSGYILCSENITDRFVPFLSFDYSTGVVVLGPPHIDDDDDHDDEKKEDNKDNKDGDDEKEEKKKVVKGKPKPVMAPQGETQEPVDEPDIPIPQTIERIFNRAVDDSDPSLPSSQSTSFGSLTYPSLDDSLDARDVPLLVEPFQEHNRPAPFSPESSQTLDFLTQLLPSESEAESTPTRSPICTPHGIVFPRSPLGPRLKRQRRSSISA